MEITRSEIKEGQRIKATTYYWRSGDDCQENVYILNAVENEGKLTLRHHDDNKPFHVGINSAVKYETL